MVRNYLFSIIAILFALIYSILPITATSIFSIDAMVLLFVSWCFLSPGSPPSLLIAWCLGLAMDLFMGCLLGEHAFALTLTLYMILSLYRRMRFFALWQQVFCVGCLTLCNQLVLALFEGFQGHLGSLFIVISPTVMTMFIWLIVGYIILYSQEALP